jgi:hypothetical protein
MPPADLAHILGIKDCRLIEATLNQQGPDELLPAEAMLTFERSDGQRVFVKLVVTEPAFALNEKTSTWIRYPLDARPC